MGREIRRVPLDFNWPVGEVWKGFLNPFYQFSKECPFCEGSGLNEETKKLSDAWYSLDEAEWVNLGNGRRYNNKAWSHHLTEHEVTALIKANRLLDFTHTWTQEKGWVKKKPAYIPTPAEVNAWSLSGMGHDGINHWVCIKARAEKLGFYGKCKHCKGEGTLWRSKEDKEKYDLWKPEDPPKGNAYQLWETVSEGSPISPPFETPEELASWLEKNPHGIDKGTTYDQWLAFIKGPGWAPSMVGTDKGLQAGVQAVV